jgi:glycerol-3-phosphate dehydrogenase
VAHLAPIRPQVTSEASPLEQRRRDLGAVAEEPLDLLVVGGGIVGCGALLDAASRGLRAALIEQDDIAVGTSSRSSRLIHGGLRYLEQLRFGLVREALDERSRLLRLAPHLVRIEPFLFPLYGLPLVHRAFYGAGVALYDMLGSRRDGGWARHLSTKQTLEWTPGLRSEGLRGGIVYHDGVEDDSRYALAVVRTAVAMGSRVLTRTRATGVIESAGRVRGVRAQDLVSGQEVEIRASAVIDCTGVWMAQADAPLGAGARVRPSKGVHLVVPRDRLESRTGLTLRIPGRVIFVIPWPGHWLIGTTDDAYAGPPDRPSAERSDVETLLGIVDRSMRIGLRVEDVVGTYTGLRPLAANPSRSGSTVKASREHRVVAEPNGIVRITGGKYTTYRVMGRDAVDAALGRTMARARPSATEELRLVGAADRPELDRLAGSLAGDPELGNLDATRAARLVDQHGIQARDVLRLGRERGLLRPLDADAHLLEAEVAWAAREELALSVDDVLSRRSRLSQERRDRGASIAGRVADIMAVELGWDEARRRLEVASYLEWAHREYDVPEPAPVLGAIRTAPAET